MEIAQATLCATPQALKATFREHTASAKCKKKATVRAAPHMLKATCREHATSADATVHATPQTIKDTFWTHLGMAVAFCWATDRSQSTNRENANKMAQLTPMYTAKGNTVTDVCRVV